MEYFKPKTRSYAIYTSLLAILTALTTVATIIIAIPFPTSTGFLNFGDALVMLSGMLLGPVGGFVAGGVGSAMGDISLGYLHFAPITLLVKGFEGLVVGLFSHKSRNARRLTIWDVIGLIIASIVMLTGYFLAEIPLVGYEAALAELLTLNWIQVTAGSILTAILGPIVRLFLQGTLYTPENRSPWNGEVEELSKTSQSTDRMEQ